MKFLNLLVALGFFALAFHAHGLLSTAELNSANRFALELIKCIMFISAQQSFSWILKELIDALPLLQINLRAVLGMIRGLSFLSLMGAAFIPFTSPNTLWVTAIFSAALFPMLITTYQAIKRYCFEIQMEEGKIITQEMMKEEKIVEQTIKQLLKGEILEDQIRMKLQTLDFDQLLDLLNESKMPHLMQKAKEFRAIAQQRNYFCYISRTIMKDPMFVEPTQKICADRANIRLDLKQPFNGEKLLNRDDIKENTVLKTEIENFLRNCINYIAQEMIAIARQHQEPREYFSHPTSITNHRLGHRAVTPEGTPSQTLEGASVFHSPVGLSFNS